MTAREIYVKTKSQMFDKPTSKAYDSYYLNHLNVILAELFAENNALREKAGKEPLEEIFQVSNENDEIDYEPQMVLNIIPKGLAAQLMIDDDPSKYSVYVTAYNNARSAIMPVQFEMWEE